jgi:hypothetical protein
VLFDAVRTVRSRPDAVALETEASTLLRSQLGSDELRRLAALGTLPDDLRPAALEGMRDSLLDAARTGATGSLDDIRWIAERESIIADPSPKLRALEALDTIVSKPDAQIDIDDLRRVERIANLPSSAKPDMPGRVGSYSLADHIQNSWLPGGDSDSRAWFNDLRWRVARERLASDPSVTRETLTRDLDAILARSDADVTVDDLRTLALLDEVPSNLRPDLPRTATSYSRKELFSHGWLPGSDSDARAEFASLRVHREGARLIEDPSVTRESTTAEALAIIDKTDEQITADDVKRLALFEQLPDGRRPAIPATSRMSMRQLHQQGALPAGDADARKEFEALRTWRQADRVQQDPAVTRATLRADLDRILAKPDAEITMDDLRFVRSIDRVAGGKRVELPRRVTAYSFDDLLANRWLPSGDGDARAEFANLRTWRERERIVEDPNVTRATLTAELDGILDKSDGEVTIADMRRLALLDDLPKELRPQLPPKATASSRGDLYRNSWLPSGDSDARAEFANLRIHREGARLVEDSSVTHDSTTAEALAIIDKTDEQITADDVKRLALFEQLPEGRRPLLPRPARHSMGDLHRNGWLPASDRDARREFEQLRSWRQATRIDADPAITRETLRGQLETILAKPDDQVTIDDLRLIVLMERAGPAKRIELPARASSYTRQSLLDNGWLPGSDSEARVEFASLRGWVQLVHDPSVTKSSLTDEVARIVLKPDAEVTQADLERLATLDDLPSNLKPELPRRATSYSRRELANFRSLPGRDSDATREFASLRQWAMLETDTGRAVARERVQAGEQLDPITLAALARGGENALASIGLSSEDLLRSTVASLRAASPEDLSSLDQCMRLAKELLDSTPKTPATRAIIEDASTLFDRNIQRIAGRSSGGYSNYPDFAELGRAIEQAELVASLRAAERAPATTIPEAVAPAVDAGAGAVADAADGVEQLTW